jgi:aurora kinase, other
MNDSKTFFLRPNKLLTFPHHQYLAIYWPESEIPYKVELSNKYKIIEQIGNGTWSDVYSGFKRENNKQVAIKKIKKIRISTDKMRDQIRREINIQQDLKHPNIIELYEAFEDDFNIHLVLEYAEGGELFYQLRGPEHTFSEKKAAAYIMDICKGVDFCHRSNVIHRDIKAENVLISSDGHLKIADFGWSVKTLSKCNSFCGTFEYLSPQICMGNSYGCDCDIWAIGILLYEMLCGVCPFGQRDCFENNEENTNWLDIKQAIIDKDITFDHKNLSKEAKDFLTKLLKKNIDDRIIMSDIFSHKWIVKMVI